MEYNTPGATTQQSGGRCPPAKPYYYNGYVKHAYTTCESCNVRIQFLAPEP